MMARDPRAFDELLRHWIAESPSLSQADLLNRARREGYRGDRSAFYELARRLRRELSGR
jgi:hypothetical protein